jgi:hypothetical protein
MLTGDILWLMVAQDAHRQDSCSIKYLFGHIGAEIAYDFALVPRFPLLGIPMSIAYHLVKFLQWS